MVIACFNGERTFVETLDGLVVQEWDRPWEIILADNGSTDRTAAIFEDYARRHPDLPMRLVDASACKGKSHALNAGIAAARGSRLLFCDADDVPGPGWLRAMAEALETCDMVACRIDFAKLNPDWLRDYRTNSQINGLTRLPYPPYVYHAGGGTIGFRRSVFEATGTFDPAFRYFEDTEFCVRAQMQGFEIHYLPDAVIHVRLRPDLKSIYRQAYNYGKYNVLLSKTYKGHGPRPKGALATALRLPGGVWPAGPLPSPYSKNPKPWPRRPAANGPWAGRPAG